MLKKKIHVSLLSGMLMLSMSMAGQTRDQRITVDMEQVTVAEFLDNLHKQTGMEILYGDDVAKDASRFKILAKETPVETLLHNVLINRNYVYTVEGNTITVQKAYLSADGNAHLTRIVGRVVDETGAPVIGATVLLDDTRIATVTSANGIFMLSVPSMQKPVITVSFIGMKSKRVNISGKTGIIVKLTPDNSMLDEVVVTGYQNIRKSEMVGSNSMVKGKDLAKYGTSSLEQMLQGKLAGTVVTNTSGLVGQRQKVRMRGTSTLLGSQEPVWVVDGIIQTDPLPFKAQELNSFGQIDQDNMDMIRNFVGSSISWLNPNDIDQITVLKDASATVLYGVKAANGVIVITTKKGTKGRMSVSYSGGLSVSERIRYSQLNLMNSRERNDVSREAYERRLLSNHDLQPIGYEGLLSQYLNREISYSDFQEQARYLDTINTDWLKLLFHNSLSTNHSVSISGGNDRISYYSSLYGNFTNGTQIGNSSNKYGASLSVDAWIAKNLLVSASISGSFGKTKSNYGVDPYTYATTTSRAIPCYSSDGSLYYYPKNYQFGYLYNVLNERDESGNSNDQRTLNTSVRLQWDFLKGFRFESTLGVNLSNVTGSDYASEHTNAITEMRGYEYGQYTPNDEKYKASRIPHGGRYDYSENHARSYSWTNQLSYNKVWKDTHRFSALVGAEIRSEKYDGYNTTQYGYLPGRGKTFVQLPLTYMISGNVYDNDLYNDMTNNVVDRLTNYVGFYSSASYSYRERYTLTASLRTDASNRFGQDTRNRFLPVWSIGTRWNVINEKWMEHQRLFTQLAVRLTYGWQGNVAENYSPDLIAKIPSYPMDRRTGEYILNIKSLAYADLRWEKTKTWNFGLDMGFWNNRLQLSFEYYNKLTTDLITEKTVPMEFGVDSTPINSGKMRNRGLELTVSTTLIQNKKWNWTLSLNTSKNWNSVRSTMNENKNWLSATTGALNKQGYPVQSVWAFEFTGINQTNGDPTFKIPTAEECPEGVTDATAYMKWMGSLEPDFTGGLSSTLRYADWVFGANFNLNLGGVRFRAPMFTTFNDTPSAYSNLPADFVNRWRKEGDVTDVPGIPSKDLGDRQVLLPNGNYAYSYQMYNYSDIRVVKASYMRCSNLSLGYILPRKWLRPIGVSNLQLTLAVTNPFTIKNKSLKGQDPEVATGSQPVARSWSANVSISF